MRYELPFTQLEYNKIDYILEVFDDRIDINYQLTGLSFQQTTEMLTSVPNHNGEFRLHRVLQSISDGTNQIIY